MAKKQILSQMKETPEFRMAQEKEELGKVFSKIKRVILIMSGKGGVGKSTVSVNLAIALSKTKKVGILDVDLHGPNVPRLLGLTGNLELNESKTMAIPKKHASGVQVVSVESLLKDPDQPILWRGPMKRSAIYQFLTTIDWPELDFLIVDSPPGTGDEAMAILEMIPNLEIIVVTTPQALSLADVKKAIGFLKHTKSNILGIIENMHAFFCSNCNTIGSFYEKDRVKKFAKEQGLRLMGSIIMNAELLRGGESGSPVVFEFPDNIISEEFFKISAELIKKK